jgi:hypothetical protein
MVLTIKLERLTGIDVHPDDEMGLDGVMVDLLDAMPLRMSAVLFTLLFHHLAGVLGPAE